MSREMKNVMHRGSLPSDSTVVNHELTLHLRIVHGIFDFMISVDRKTCVKIGKVLVSLINEKVVEGRFADSPFECATWGRVQSFKIHEFHIVVCTTSPETPCGV
ncbi:hypothetical protein R1flu_005867 [Riccia fluitans]|uniref:Uncharacterized protein n=1 Tax=Riccia fluitans TaxID=41844 RepID=A0ABD1YV38_9MARC